MPRILWTRATSACSRREHGARLMRPGGAVGSGVPVLVDRSLGEQWLGMKGYARNLNHWPLSSNHRHQAQFLQAHRAGGQPDGEGGGGQ